MLDPITTPLIIAKRYGSKLGAQLKNYSGKKKQQLIECTLEHPRLVKSLPGKYILGYLLPGETQNNIEERFGMEKYSLTKVSIAVDTTSSLIKLGWGLKILKNAISRGELTWVSAIEGSASTFLFYDGLRGVSYCGWRLHRLLKKSESTGAYFCELPYRVGKGIKKKIARQNSQKKWLEEKVLERN